MYKRQLGLSLWQKEEREEEKDRKPQDNLEFHNIWAIKKRIELFITSKAQGGMSMDDILSCLNMSEIQYKNAMRAFEMCIRDKVYPVPPPPSLVP